MVKSSNNWFDICPLSSTKATFGWLFLFSDGVLVKEVTAIFDGIEAHHHYTIYSGDILMCIVDETADACVVFLPAQTFKPARVSFKTI